MLEFTKKMDEGVLILEPAGRIDTTTAHLLDDEIKKIADQLENFTLDFAGVEYISSAGLRVLLSAHKLMMKKGEFKITNVRDEIMEVFEMTGFADILNIE